MGVRALPSEHGSELEHAAAREQARLAHDENELLVGTCSDLCPPLERYR